MSKWRSILSGVLIVVACVLGPLTVAAVWVSDEIGSTSRYVATMAPLASNPDVQAGVTNRITDAVIQQTDVNGLVTGITQGLASATSALPQVSGEIGSLTGPLTSGITGFVHATVQKVVTSDQFQTLWSDANRTAHAAVVKLLTGKGGVVNDANDQVTIDLGPVVDKVRQQLVADGFGLAAKIPEVHTDFVIAQGSSLSQARTGFRALQIVGNWLPPALAVLIGLGIWLARDRRKALIRAALGVTLGMIVLAIALAVGRHIYLDKLPGTVSKPAATAVYDALVSFLRVSARTIGVLALVVAVGAFFTGPSGFATKVRALCTTVLDGCRALAAKVGFGPDPIGWVHRYRRWIAYGAVVGASVWFVLLEHPRVPTVLWLTAGVLAVLALLEFLDPRGPVSAERAAR